MSNIDGLITKVLSDDIKKKGKAGDWTISNVKCQCGKTFNTVEGALYHQHEHPLPKKTKWYQFWK